jgi:hypothetical protein
MRQAFRLKAQENTAGDQSLSRLAHHQARIKLHAMVSGCG